MPLYRLQDKHKLESFEQKDFGKENYESRLEDWLLANPEVLTGDPILYIQRERPITREQDLLGIDQDGNMIVIELKRGRTPREVIAQILEYAAEVESLTYKDLSEIAQTYFKETEASHRNLIDAFQETFVPVLGGNVDVRIEELPQRINQRQRLFIVAQEIDEQVEAVARYLRKNGMDVTCVQFSYYQTADGETVVSVETTVGREPTEHVRKEVGPPKAKHPPELREFLIAVRERVRDVLPEEFRNFEAYKNPKVELALWYEPPGWGARYQAHFGGYESSEIYTPLLVAIRLEFKESEMNEQIYRVLQERESEWRSVLGKEVNLERTGPKTRLLYEELDWSGNTIDLNDKFQNRVVERLALLIKTLKLIIDDVCQS